MSIRWKLSHCYAYLHHLQIWPFTFNIWQVEIGKVQKFPKTLNTKLCSDFSTGTSPNVLKERNNVWSQIFQLLWNVYIAKVVVHEMYLPFIMLFWWWAFTKWHLWHFKPVLFYQPINLEIIFLEKCDSVSSICLQSMGNLLSIWRMHCSYFLVCHVFLLQWKKKVIVLFNFRVETW